MPFSPTISDATCRRCGTCCRRGGPALHLEDRGLVESGRIPLTDLVTLRPGEMVHENVKNRLTPAPTDIIKIRGSGGGWSCCYLGEDSGCGIYEDRPEECRALDCRAPEALLEIYEKNRLTRAHLLAGTEGLWHLVQEHEQHCDMILLRRLFDGFSRDGSEVYLRRISDVVNYDREFRKALAASDRLNPALFDFLFGRPAGDLLFMFGYRLKQDGSRERLMRLSTGPVLRSAGGPPCQQGGGNTVRVY